MPPGPSTRRTPFAGLLAWVLAWGIGVMAAPGGIAGEVAHRPAPSALTAQGRPRLGDSALIREVQRRTFLYFWEGAEPHSGAARERFHVDGDYPDHDAHIVTSGGTGFGIMALLVGIERGFITRAEGAERLTRIVGFLE
ncbi:MAG: hypothetical protein ACKPAH_02275, partial [Verrucomicrobiota bacterium]